MSGEWGMPFGVDCVKCPSCEFAFDAARTDEAAADGYSCPQCGHGKCNSIIEAAVALRLAAIILRDIADAMPPQAFVSMPDDIRRRLMHHRYEDAFMALPQEIRAVAETLVMADPDLIEARRVDSESRHSRERA